MTMSPEDVNLLNSLAERVTNAGEIGDDLGAGVQRLEDAGLVRWVRSSERSYVILTGSGILASRAPRKPRRSERRRVPRQAETYISA